MFRCSHQVLILTSSVESTSKTSFLMRSDISPVSVMTNLFAAKGIKTQNLLADCTAILLIHVRTFESFFELLELFFQWKASSPSSESSSLENFFLLSEHSIMWWPNPCHVSASLCKDNFIAGRKWNQSKWRTKAINHRWLFFRALLNLVTKTIFFSLHPQISQWIIFLPRKCLITRQPRHRAEISLKSFSWTEKLNHSTWAEADVYPLIDVLSFPVRVLWKLHQ